MNTKELSDDELVQQCLYRGIETKIYGKTGELFIHATASAAVLIAFGIAILHSNIRWSSEPWWITIPTVLMYVTFPVPGWIVTWLLFY